MSRLVLSILPLFLLHTHRLIVRAGDPPPPRGGGGPPPKLGGCPPPRCCGIGRRSCGLQGV